MELKKFTPPAIIALLLISCLDPYEPDGSASVEEFIVVDGFVNTRDATVTVIIQRTLPIASEDRPPAIEDADVSINTSTGGVFKLHEKEPGKYIAERLSVGVGQTYVLHIVTPNGYEYTSDAITSYDTPSIDSITSGLSNSGDGLMINVNTHNNKKSTGYYAWDFSETFEYTAPTRSGMINTPAGPRRRRPEEDFFRCWRTDPGTKISITTTKALGADVVRNFNLFTIPQGSLKLTVRYSVLVKQRTIDVEEFNYLSLLKKTTESVGGLFDPMPAPVRGNIHRVGNPAEPVLGYFRAGDVEELRYFIDFDELPETLRVIPAAICQIYKTCPKPMFRIVGPGPTCLYINDLPDFYPVIEEFEYARDTLYWTYASNECVNCLGQGGLTKRPDFWPTN